MSYKVYSTVTRIVQKLPYSFKLVYWFLLYYYNRYKYQNISLQEYLNAAKTNVVTRESLVERLKQYIEEIQVVQSKLKSLEPEWVWSTEREPHLKNLERLVEVAKGIEQQIKLFDEKQAKQAKLEQQPISDKRKRKEEYALLLAQAKLEQNTK